MNDFRLYYYGRAILHKVKKHKLKHKHDNIESARNEAAKLKSNKYDNKNQVLIIQYFGTNDYKIVEIIDI